MGFQVGSGHNQIISAPTTWDGITTQLVISMESLNLNLQILARELRTRDGTYAEFCLTSFIAMISLGLLKRWRRFGAISKSVS